MKKITLSKFDKYIKKQLSKDGGQLFCFLGVVENKESDKINSIFFYKDYDREIIYSWEKGGDRIKQMIDEIKKSLAKKEKFFKKKVK
jgi:hypothetical protein